MYHAICLRKWLYMQDSCPMCHEKLYQSDATSQTEQELMEPPPAVVLQPREAGDLGEAAELQDINQNYLEDSDDYIDISSEEELETWVKQRSSKTSIKTTWRTVTTISTSRQRR